MGAVSFNQPLNSWNVSNVTDMYDMFLDAESFNQPLDSWNQNFLIVNKVTEWFENKEKAEEKYGPISEWDTSKVTNMSLLFEDRKDFNENISKWNVSNVIDMKNMFFGA